MTKGVKKAPNQGLNDVLNESQLAFSAGLDPMRKHCPQSAQLFDLVFGPLRWNLLQMGFEWGIFDALRESKEVEVLAANWGFKADKTALMLDAMVSMDWLVKNGNSYQLSAQMAPLLLSDSPGSMRHMLLHLGCVRHMNPQQMRTILETGEANHISANFAQPEFWNRAYFNLRSFHTSLSNQVALDILYQLPQWPNVKRMLDIGAGSECLARSLVADNPALDVVVFDLPPCAARIEQALKPHELKQVSIIAGDYNETGLKHEESDAGYDLIWASMSLYFAKDLRELLRQIRAALNPGGVFVSLHEGLYGNRTKPETHVVGRLVPALNGTNVSFEKGVIANYLLELGFTRVESKTLHTAYGPLELDIASN